MDLAARPRFLITIDTEGDNLWARPRAISTKNAHFLPRFQALCERHGLRPTYLVNYEMACAGALREFGSAHETQVRYPVSGSLASIRVSRAFGAAREPRRAGAAVRGALERVG